MDKNYTNKEYETYVSKKSKPSPITKNIFFAFIIGGTICLLGECIKCFYLRNGFSIEISSGITSMTLIFLSALFTGLDIYDNLAKYAGAGTLVPITGFANAITAPAIEFKSEGYILGVGAKMFVVAGPVIVYGILSSSIAGLVYFFLM